MYKCKYSPDNGSSFGIHGISRNYIHVHLKQVQKCHVGIGINSHSVKKEINVKTKLTKYMYFEK